MIEDAENHAAKDLSQAGGDIADAFFMPVGSRAPLQRIDYFITGRHRPMV